MLMVFHLGTWSLQYAKMSVMMRGIDVSAASHILLQDVVLDGPGYFVGGNPLFFGHGDIHGEEDGGGGVDGHGSGDLVERNAVEEDLHVGQRVDGNAHLPHFPLAHGGLL